jgi:FPC/CPF motif-containing protein YcgG
MTGSTSADIINGYFSFLADKSFPCIGAKAALAKDQIQCMVAGHMACPSDDVAILQFLYNFVESYRNSKGSFHSAAIIFSKPSITTEEIFEELLWSRLGALRNLDEKNYACDSRVDPDPSSANFSFSLKEEAFFIVGLHPGSSRRARQFQYPALVFNPHAEFEKLRKQHNGYERLKAIVRKRDILYSGSVNPMLQDFGLDSEARQYSGRRYSNQWECPLAIDYGKIDNHSSP